GVYAIINLKDAFLKLDKTPKELELMYKSSDVDIVLFFWPDADSFTDIKRGNAASLFLRVLLEVCSTVCMKVSQSELDNFYVDKQTVQDNTNEEEQSMGGGIQVGMKEQQKNDVSYNVEKMKSLPTEKERKQSDSNVIVTSRSAFVIEGVQSTILCYHSVLEHVTESKQLQFTYSSKEELINFIKKITQTHRLILWNEVFDTWEKASIFVEAICPELIKEFDERLHLSNKEYEEKISTAHSEAQERYNSQKKESEADYGKFFGYKCWGLQLKEMKGIVKVMPDEKINNFENGVQALTEWIPNVVSYHPFSHNRFRYLDEDITNLYKVYENNLSHVVKMVKKQLERDKKEANKEGNSKSSQTGEEEKEE
ncbi:hypothetical protein RFI_34114, partial [Reticulomyxa filosa]